MAVRLLHNQEDNTTYFITFTCFQWIPLFEISTTYSSVYKWFSFLQQKDIKTVAFVIMPNHLHCLLYFDKMSTSLNTIVSNAKRFMAQDILKQLATNKETELLQRLAAAVKPRERKKGQLHKVFEESFDAKPCISKDFTWQKINYIHNNPVSGKWNLAKEAVSYPHSSAGFYEGIEPVFKGLTRIEDIW
jgi:putative transposase